MITRRSLLSLLIPPIWLPWIVNSKQPEVEPVAPTIQWEYKLEVIQTVKGWPEVLAKRGSEGWQLASRTDRPGVVEFIWMRPKNG